MMHKTGTPVQVSPLPPDEAAVLLFLKRMPGTRFSTEHVGRAVRPLVLKKPATHTDSRTVRTWAGVRLNKLFKRMLVKKAAGPGTSLVWWAD